MRRPIAITLPFHSPAGTIGAVHLSCDQLRDDRARLSITKGRIITGSSADAHLSIDSMRQLVDGLMDCINGLEYRARHSGENSDGGRNGHAA